MGYKHLKNIFLTLSLGLSLVACSGSGVSTYSDAAATPTTSGITVYFSDPDSPTAGAYQNGPDAKLVAAINQAQRSIDMAIYELSLDTIVQSLIDAHQRGVTVRVLTDTDNLDWEAFQTLRAAGIAVKGDGRSALMHNKFTVIDDTEVWTGSMNYTYYGAYRHNENLLRIQHVEAAANYAEEFEQLWRVIHNQANQADGQFSVGTVDVQVRFSPDDAIRESTLLPLLRKASQSVHMMAYSFTSDEIAAQLVALEKQGVEVKVVVDKSSSNQSGAEYANLFAQGIDIQLDGNSYKLHHKVIVIDGDQVVTGSYNFTQNAETRNDENLVIIDDASIAKLYENEFSKVYQQALESTR